MRRPRTFFLFWTAAPLAATPRLLGFEDVLDVFAFIFFLALGFKIGANGRGYHSIYTGTTPSPTCISHFCLTAHERRGRCGLRFQTPNALRILYTASSNV